MAAQPQSRISVDEYVARFIDRAEKPVCEYVDGVLIPKPMAGDDHSAVQSNLVFYLRSRYNKTLKIRLELHGKLRQTRFRVPDVMVIERDRLFEGRYPGPENAPMLCLEIQSPDDSRDRLFDKCREYHAWGVRYCWVIDPKDRRIWEYHRDDVEPRECMERISASQIEMSASEVFEDL
jgi:Uma2 family endonuclease